jgi:hypothetical protein
MDKDIDRPLHQAQEEQGAPLDPASGKQPWQEPRLTFIEPTLTKHGTLEEVTGMAFFSGFSPSRS